MVFAMVITRRRDAESFPPQAINKPPSPFAERKRKVYRLGIVQHAQPGHTCVRELVWDTRRRDAPSLAGEEGN